MKLNLLQMKVPLYVQGKTNIRSWKEKYLSLIILAAFSHEGF
jgi:hypothetical protein